MDFTPYWFLGEIMLVNLVCLVIPLHALMIRHPAYE